MLNLDTIRAIAERAVPHARFRDAWPLTGGVSAQVIAIEVEADGPMRRLVLRCHGEADLQRDPDIATHEYALLSALNAAGLAVPKPVHLDTSCELLPNPYLITTYMDGDTGAAPPDRITAARRMAAYLASLHGLDVAELELPFLADMTEAATNRLSNRPSTLNAAMQEARIRDALEAAWPLLQRNRTGLLHGDYWPGNVLWRDGRITAVVDWEDAVVGDPLADVANARLELLWAYGMDAMHAFTEEYLALTSVEVDNLPVWDLYAALRPIAGLQKWGLDADVVERMIEQHRWFADAALERLSRA